MPTIENCSACGGAHSEDDEPPVLCHHVMALAAGLAAYLTEDTDESAQTLLETCQSICGIVDDDDDDEVFG